MMRDEKAELQRKDKQRHFTGYCTFDTRLRRYGKAKSELIQQIIASKGVGDVCEHHGKQYLWYEWLAGRQTKSEKHTKLDPKTEWLVEDEWEDLEDALFHAVDQIERVAPLGFDPRLFIADALDSYDEELLLAMRHWRLRDISVDRVGAHLMSLGIDVDNDQFAALTRRFTMALLNHQTYWS